MADYGFVQAVWLLALAITLHMVEEVIWLPAWSLRAGFWHVPVGAKEFAFASAVLVGLVWLVALAGAQAGPESLGAYLATGLAPLMFFNVIYPHLGAAIHLRRYAPGLATAVALNLPATAFLMERAFAEGYVSPWRFGAAAALWATAAAVCWTRLFVLGRWLLGLFLPSPLRGKAKAMTPRPWQALSNRPRLADDEVHVWWVRLDLPAAALERLAQSLDRDERERADQFYFEEGRRRFIASHGALRILLGRYLDLPPEEVMFDYDAHGKPSVIQTGSAQPLRFNLSHSHEIALIGVARGREIGVDIEHIRPDRADEQLARRFFSPHEVETLLSLPAEQQTEAFFRCWTRKEAYLKARGDGLSFPLDQFDVSLSPEEPALLSVGGDRLAAAGWRLADLGVCPGYAAVLAVEGDGWRLQCRQWPEQ